MTAYPAHPSGGHGLPVSNGFSGTDAIGVYCGRCKRSFAATPEWAARYLVAVERDLHTHLTQPPSSPYRISQAEYDKRIGEYLEQFRRGGLGLLPAPPVGGVSPDSSSAAP